MNITILIGLLNATIPGAINLARDIIDLFKKYPGVTSEQFMAIVTEVATKADSAYDATINEIIADQNAHQVPVPPSPPSPNPPPPAAFILKPLR